MKAPITDADNYAVNVISTILGKIGHINKTRKKFMLHLFMLFMGIRGRYNFWNMARYGEYDEHSYRNNFSNDFDFLCFNKELVKQCCSNHIVIAFDPSYIPKSGKHTDHLGWFWSGTSGKAMKGLEIGGIAAVDVKNNTAMSLEAIQTPSAQELHDKGMTLVTHYAQLIIARAITLKELSDYIVTDGYFAKDDFINPILEKTSLHIIGKLRSDANLWYPYEGKPTGQKGRPKLYTKKMDVEKIDKKRFRLCYEDKSVKVYEAILYCKMLQRKIKVAYVERWEDGKYGGDYAILFSTGLTLKGKLVYQYYKSRFQIEFLYRDAKQHCGLTHCQARDEHKLNFHFNTSLSTVSLAKAIYYLDVKNRQERIFSMSDIKTLCFNKLIVKRFIANLDADLSPQKISKLYNQALFFGCIRPRAA